MNDKATNLIGRLEAKITAAAERLEGGFPFLARQDHYEDITKRMPQDGIHIWTNGFWPGMLWQMYHVTHKETLKELAETLGERLGQGLSQYDKLTHDVGFIHSLASVTEYKTTGSPTARSRALQAAGVLAGRFNPQGKFIRAWNESRLSDDIAGWMIIDCMMNLQLLFWASKETGDPRFAAIARQHADTAMAYSLRSDGSASHITEMNPETGEFVRHHAGQGYEADSAWSRGQGWAVYGFALCYKHTGDVKYLEAAKSCAHYCMANLALQDWLPLCDFKAPADPVKYDSTAGPLLACAFEEISRHVEENEKPLYRKAAKKTLFACAEKFGNWDTEKDYLLAGGTLQYHGEDYADTPVIYGDYFYVEAYLRIMGQELEIW
ncbi:glycoside hydrolase family 88 protein [Lachnospiraceae bacterium OttesenSCG-928-D06]|nr:glycoside hydrolase family 88 protein [Lachnospiraceae bacterium OttesenSCG-928-D06]